MKIFLRILLVIGVIVALGIAYFLIFHYFKPHVDYAKAKPDIEVTGEVLYSAFVSDALRAAAVYNGKVLLVEGIVDALEQSDDLNVAVMIYDDGFFGPEGVRFTLLEGQEEKVVAGENLFLKGFCTGFTGSDVIIEHASVVKP